MIVCTLILNTNDLYIWGQELRLSRNISTFVFNINVQTVLVCRDSLVVPVPNYNSNETVCTLPNNISYYTCKNTELVRLVGVGWLVLVWFWFLWGGWKEFIIGL